MMDIEHSVTKKHLAATLIQKHIRGFFCRKQFQIPQLKKNELTDIYTFVIGNDPDIKEIEHHIKPDEKSALIGTSGLRALSLACRLSSTPSNAKLIIIDNSKFVVDFWRKLRALVETSSFNEKSHFLAQFTAFLKTNEELIALFSHDYLMPASKESKIDYLSQDPIKFMDKLIDKHGINNVMSMIKNSTILASSWTDSKLFYKLKNILALNGVKHTFVYPSNIAHCIPFDEPQLLQQFFRNLETINPKLSIHTDLCDYHVLPERVILSSETNTLKSTLFPDLPLCPAALKEIKKENALRGTHPSQMEM
jgi:IQ calmodulin-binding motif